MVRLVEFIELAPGGTRGVVCLPRFCGRMSRDLELAKLLSFPDLIVPSNDGYKMADEVYFE